MELMDYRVTEPIGKQIFLSNPNFPTPGSYTFFEEEIFATKSFRDKPSARRALNSNEISIEDIKSSFLAKEGPIMIEFEGRGIISDTYSFYVDEANLFIEYTCSTPRQIEIKNLIGNVNYSISESDELFVNSMMELVDSLTYSELFELMESPHYSLKNIGARLREVDEIYSLDLVHIDEKIESARSEYFEPTYEPALYRKYRTSLIHELVYEAYDRLFSKDAEVTEDSKPKKKVRKKKATSVKKKKAKVNDTNSTVEKTEQTSKQSKDELSQVEVSESTKSPKLTPAETKHEVDGFIIEKI